MRWAAIISVSELDPFTAFVGTFGHAPKLCLRLLSDLLPLQGPDAGDARLRHGRGCLSFVYVALTIERLHLHLFLFNQLAVPVLSFLFGRVCLLSSRVGHVARHEDAVFPKVSVMLHARIRILIILLRDYPLIRVVQRHYQPDLADHCLGRGNFLLLSDELVFHNLQLKVQLAHFLVHLLQASVEHLREDVLLDQLSLLLCGFLVAQRIKFPSDLVFGHLDKVPPDGLFLLKGTLVLGQKVVQKRDFNEIFIGYNQALLVCLFR